MNEVLISLAKAAILVALGHSENFDLEKALKNYPELKKNTATFITLKTIPHNKLRGCIGSLDAYQPLYKDIIVNAQSAALRDPRFKPVSLEEFNNIKIEISILTEAKVLRYTNVKDLKSKIKPFKDGVVLKYGNKHATYLPQVWEQLTNFDDFFESLCNKAKLDSNCLIYNPEIFTYQVKKYKEK